MKNKRTTVYEDEYRREQEYRKKHTVTCPHCGKEILDHMTECPHCKGKVDTKRYQPLSDSKIKKIRIVTYTVGIAVALVILVLYFTLWRS